MLDKGNVYILTADNVLPDPDKTLSTVKMYILALSSIINGYQLITNFLMVIYHSHALWIVCRTNISTISPISALYDVCFFSLIPGGNSYAAIMSITKSLTEEVHEECNEDCIYSWQKMH
jgi:hypothetical protein